MDIFTIPHVGSHALRIAVINGKLMINLEIRGKLMKHSWLLAMTERSLAPIWLLLMWNQDLSWKKTAGNSMYHIGTKASSLIYAEMILGMDFMVDIIEVVSPRTLREVDLQFCSLETVGLIMRW